MNNIKITARKRTQCACTEWVVPGTKSLWNKDTKRTIGCETCRMTGEYPDPYANLESNSYLLND